MIFTESIISVGGGRPRQISDDDIAFIVATALI
jgi:hypothetical protein